MSYDEHGRAAYILVANHIKQAAVRYDDMAFATARKMADDMCRKNAVTVSVYLTYDDGEWAELPAYIAR